MLIFVDTYVYRFESESEAITFGERSCRSNFDYYIVIDTEKDEVVG